MTFPARLRRPVAATVTGLMLSAGLLGGAVRAYTAEAETSTYGSGVTKVVALGDSVTAGTNCDCDDFPQLIGQDLSATSGGATVSNFGKPGETSGELALQVNLPEVTDALTGADVVVITIGANDIDVEDADDPAPVVADLATNIDQILARVASTAPGAKTVVTGYWNVVQDGAVAADNGPDYVAESHVITDAVNAVLQQRAAANGVLYTDLAQAYAAASPDATTLLADDGDHPDAEGHRVIAQAIEATLAAADHPAGSVPSPMAGPVPQF